MKTTNGSWHLARSASRALIGWVLLWLVSIPGHCDLSLGIHTEEPAAVADLLKQLTPGGESIAIVPYFDAKQLTNDLASQTLDLALLEDPLAPIRGVNVIRELYPRVLHVLHRADRAAPGIEDLFADAKVWSGARDGLAWRLSRAIADDYDLDGETFWLDDPWSDEPDVYSMFGGILEQDARNRLTGFRLWSLDDPTRLMHGSVAEAFSLRYPNLRPFILPAGLYPELSAEPALTISVTTVLAARAGLEEERAYSVAAELDRAMPLVAAAYPLAGLPQPMRDTGARYLSLHPGAQRYVDRNLPSFLERYAEIFALVATIIIGAISTVLALQRRRRQTRKDRLDQYYERVLEHRVDGVADEAARQRAKGEIQRIQKEVFSLVAAERIDADAALVAFLSLSNQLLQEADSHDSP